MAERISLTQVGAPDPEKNTSMIIDEAGGNDTTGVDPDSVEFASCYFNDVGYPDGSQVCSGDELLLCQRGKWLRTGSCDMDNP